VREDDSNSCQVVQVSIDGQQQFFLDEDYAMDGIGPGLDDDSKGPREDIQRALSSSNPRNEQAPVEGDHVAWSKDGRGNAGHHRHGYILSQAKARRSLLTTRAGGKNRVTVYNGKERKREREKKT
jgi:hypothetical protein